MDKKHKRKGNFFLVLFFGILIGVGGTMIFSEIILDDNPKNPNIGVVEAQTKDFVNNNLLDPTMDASILINEEKSGVYELLVSVEDESLISYVTKDGKLFFPTAYEIDSSVNTDKNTNNEQEIVVKNDKPTVELFVMSYCPYGLQAEKGLIPAVNLLGDKIDFNLRFVNYAMHGEKEVAENTRQYCVQKTQPEKLNGYLSCFANKAEPIICGEENDLNEAMIDVCVKETDDEYNVSGLFNDQSTWVNGQFPPFLVDDARNREYGVRGSPTLVINGVVSQPIGGRHTNGYMNAICKSFNNEPEECDQATSVSIPQPGFGSDTTTDNTQAQC